MENNEINTKEVCDILNEIMEYELAGVVRYTHSSMMVSGPYRLPIVTFLKEQAEESLLHAQLAGEKIAGLDGHPSQKIAKIEETNRHTIKDILEESLEYFDPKTIRDIINKELIDLSEAHHERYFKKSN